MTFGHLENAHCICGYSALQYESHVSLLENGPILTLYQNETFKNQLFRTESRAAFISTLKEAVTLMFAFYSILQT